MRSPPFATSPTPSVEPPSEPALVTGERRFGRYALCYELASGGMGTVYLARAEGPHGFEKLVALKRIHEHLAKEPKFVDMFLDEARIAGQIHHPNVCGVIDFGQHEGRYYLTMPFLMGESLHRVLRAVSRSAMGDAFLPIASRMIADACEGLHAAHELTDDRGEPLEVVHRDVSPQNILVGYDGGVRILDFGVASARQRLYSTATGEVKGKFAYIAPEQIQGEAVDRRADIWSLGVVLYECVAARRLFGKKTMAQTVNAVLTEPIRPLRELRPDVPLALEEIVFKALARDPERRYATARAMGRDLLEYLAEDRIVVGPGDVSETMSALFPDGLAQKRTLLERAKADASVDALIDEEGLPTDATQAPTVTETPSSRPRAKPLADPTPAAPARRPWLLAVALLATLAVGAAGAISWQRWSGDGTELEASAATASPAPVAAGDDHQGTEETEDGAGASASGAARERSTAADDTASDGNHADGNHADGNHADGNDDTRGSEGGGARSDLAAGSGAAEANGAEREGAGDAQNGEAHRASSGSAERPRRSSADRAPGRLSVVTPGGWAFVYRGRRRLGEAPNVFALPAGAHTIGVQPLGRGPIRRYRVRIQPGETTRLVAGE